MLASRTANPPNPAPSFDVVSGPEHYWLVAVTPTPVGALGSRVSLASRSEAIPGPGFAGSVVGGIGFELTGALYF